MRHAATKIAAVASGELMRVNDLGNLRDTAKRTTAASTVM
jgi:hypothetical protein